MGLRYAFDALRGIQQRKASHVFKGFREFLAKGNIIDLSVAVVIGTAFTGLVTKFTDSIITPLINRIGAGKDSDYGILKIGIGGGQSIDLNILLSALINFTLIAAVVYFLIVLPYGKIRRTQDAAQDAAQDAEEAAEDKQIALLTEIRDSLRTK